MDYYKVLGLSRDATKDEIKEAFRDIAKKFHPDKHSASPKSVRDGATVRFKQASEAYEVLVDDHKRADYNFRSNFSNQGARSGSGYGYGYGYTYDSRKNNDYYGSKKATVSRFQIALGYINSRAFLLNVAFAGNRLKKQWNLYRRQKRLRKRNNGAPHFPGCMEVPWMNTQFNSAEIV
ncbi:chaperone protein dnaJ 72 isoform X1 [Cynara cardunculus var. scolymus]|uniref:chaperone protein dnaJ 72 isoform X1 n=1 Tax=Cynara cardunculus var. scolymus TaxID=59895 RepID=UPI000D6259C9|nr:chaperone protein dnaJ 72 isoform X1 [Cynara cardunculus var. scolymus]